MHFSFFTDQTQAHVGGYQRQTPAEANQESSIPLCAYIKDMLARCLIFLNEDWIGQKVFQQHKTYVYPSDLLPSPFPSSSRSEVAIQCYTTYRETNLRRLSLFLSFDCFIQKRDEQQDIMIYNLIPSRDWSWS